MNDRSDDSRADATDALLLTPIRMIAVDHIRVVNPRARDQKKFRLLVENISKVGLKKPIRVSERKEADENGPLYDLVCGQGRLEAFIALGQTAIPAQVGQTDREQQLIMSLVENIARRQPLRFEHIQHIVALKERGYSAKQIAEKIDVTDAYIMAILHLWEKGEERLLRAVEAGTIPVSMAVDMVRVSDADAQLILVDAYESKKLRGTRLLAARRLLEARRTYGKKMTRVSGRRKTPASADALARSYQREVQRQKLFVKKARLCESRLIFIVAAMKQLISDENFVTLLRAEKLDTIPLYLAERIGAKVHAATP